MDKKEKAKKIISELKKLFPDAKIALNYSNNWELLVATILSAQCTDKTVNRVTEDLFKKYSKLEDYTNATLEHFSADIKSITFYNNKAKNILATAKIIQEKYNGTVPDKMDELLNLPGVARKTANVVMGNAFGHVEGIVVDTHVRRLSNLFGLTTNQDPVKIEKDLMEIVPKEYWYIFPYLLIDFGRAYCTARPHDHSEHPLSDFITQK